MRAVWLAVMAGFFFCTAASPARADDDQPYNKQGFVAYQAGDYAAAFAAFSRGREAGESHSMRNLGILYVYGQGTARDVQKPMICSSRPGTRAMRPRAIIWAG